MHAFVLLWGSNHTSAFSTSYDQERQLFHHIIVSKFQVPLHILLLLQPNRSMTLSICHSVWLVYDKNFYPFVRSVTAWLDPISLEELYAHLLTDHEILRLEHNNSSVKNLCFPQPMLPLGILRRRIRDIAEKMQAPMVLTKCLHLTSTIIPTVGEVVAVVHLLLPPQNLYANFYSHSSI